jgi:hypothetical protein
MCVKDGNLIRNKPESKYFEFFTSFEEQEMTKVISVNNLYDIKHAEIFYDIVMQKAMIK